MNKIGLHIISGTRVALGPARIVTLANVDLAYKQQVRAEIGADGLIMIRWVEEQPALTDPEQQAEHWVARHYADLRAMADLNVVYQGRNEPPDEEAAAFARFEVTRLRLLHAMGLRAGVGAWSVGCPDVSTWSLYRPILDAMTAGDIILLHEYWADGMDLSNPWLCGRFDLLPVRPYLAGRLIAITECGRDVVEGRGQPGWRLTCDADTFLRELRTYNDLLERHPQVVGTTVFTVGNDPRWRDFDVTDLWPRVVAGYSAAPAPAPPIQGGNMTTIRVWRRAPNTVVTLEIEEYLRGVVPGEMPPDWPTEALRAQAIAARTYSLRAVRWPRHADRGADLCDAACCQVYQSTEWPRPPSTDRAVRETAGQTWPVGTGEYVSLCGRTDIECPHCRGALGSGDKRYPGRMCQNGARVMAERGSTHRAILAHYYGGEAVDVERIRQIAWQHIGWERGGMPYNPDSGFAKRARRDSLGAPLTPEARESGIVIRGFALKILWTREGEWGLDQIRAVEW